MEAIPLLSPLIITFDRMRVFVHAAETANERNLAATLKGEQNSQPVKKKSHGQSKIKG